MTDVLNQKTAKIRNSIEGYKQEISAMFAAMIKKYDNLEIDLSNIVDVAGFDTMYLPQLDNNYEFAQVLKVKYVDNSVIVSLQSPEKDAESEPYTYKLTDFSLEDIVDLFEQVSELDDFADSLTSN